MLWFPSQVIQRQRSRGKRACRVLRFLFLIIYFSGISKVINCLILIGKKHSVFTTNYISMYQIYIYLVLHKLKYKYFLLSLCCRKIDIFLKWENPFNRSLFTKVGFKCLYILIYNKNLFLIILTTCSSNIVDTWITCF